MIDEVTSSDWLGLCSEKRMLIGEMSVTMIDGVYVLLATVATVAHVRVASKRFKHASGRILRKVMSVVFMLVIIP